MQDRFFLYLVLFISCVTNATAQMLVGHDTLVGHEWINYDASYFKFHVEEDGIYRISYDALTSAGIPKGTKGSDFKIFSHGRQVAIYVSTNDAFGNDDFIEFYGYRNKGELDRHLFRNPDDNLLNPDYSMYTDKRPYYLTLDPDVTPLRVHELTNDVSNPPDPEPDYLHTEALKFTDTSFDPYFQISGGGAISYASYMHGEGFGKLNQTQHTSTIDARDIGQGTTARLHLRLTSTNYGNHEFILSWNGEVLDTLFKNNIEITDTSYILPLTSVLENNELTITNNTSISRFSVVSISLTYPKEPVLGNEDEAVITLHQLTETQHYHFNAFSVDGDSPVLYTRDGLTRMETKPIAGDQFHFVWPPTPEETTVHIANPSTAIPAIDLLEEVRFTDLTDDDTEYIVITHPDLMAAGDEGAYVQYRKSEAGGNYKAKAYSILDLYEQFGYGIEKHPQAIRNFTEFCHRHWPSAEMIFIIGRGIEYNKSRVENGQWEDWFFVPTFGRPGGDNLLAATLWDLMPRYPVGRLAVTSTEGVDDYLEKVKEHDAVYLAGQTLEEKAWIKNVMHLGGGKIATEQQDFENILRSLGDILSASDYGANISFFQKQSTDVIGETESAQILKLLNEGCGIINYLGHSASSTFEYNIHEPTEWDNKGRYPVFSAMGCSAGQIHGTRLSLSDNYVQTPDEGAIAFISGSGSQYATALVKWARPWYDYIGTLGYGSTLGESNAFGLQAVSDLVNPTYDGSNIYRYLLEQHTFQGDPALRLHPLPGPDYVIDRNTVSISPKTPDTKRDSLTVSFAITNIGRNLREQVTCTISILPPDGDAVVVWIDTLEAQVYENNVQVKVPLPTEGKAGSYRLLITADPFNEIDELPAPTAEQNNTLVDNLGVEGIEFIVVDNLITAVYPPDFSIVTEVVPELIATGSNSFSGSTRIALEIDTTALFNSPSKFSEVIANTSPTVKWSPGLSWAPDQVYYWRVSSDSLSAEQSFIWSTKSFLYKPGSFPGWNQSHFHQFTANQLIQLLPDSSRHDFIFDRKSTNFNILNRYHDVDQGLIPKVVEDGKIKAEFFTGFRNRNVQAFVVAIDSLTGEFMTNPNPGLYGSANHLSFDARCFPYRMDLPESRQALIDFVENVIPSGYYVFFYTYQHPLYPSYYPELWADDEAVYGKSIFTMIEAQHPLTDIRSLATADSKPPYIIFFQKDRGVIEELIGVDSSDVISMSVDIKGSLTSGQHVSRLAGPATQWYNILHETTLLSPDTAGQNTMSAIALSSDLSDTLIISTHLSTLDTMISDIDADAYPFIQLTYTTEDSVDFDPARLNMWRVHYDGYAELVLQPNAGFEFIADTLQQGETMSLWAHVENVSPHDLDSVPVSLRIISSNTTEALSTVIPELKGHALTDVAFEFNTSALQGDYQVIMEVNPERSIREIQYNNNIGIISMHVVADDANPILDVTFDGYHIQDGDIVSSRPLIAVQLHDENENLRIQDTSSFKLYLEGPLDFNPQPIYFSMPWVDFLPSPESGKNIAIVHLTPELLEDGIYTFIVNAKDASGNLAGDIHYSVSFEVMNARAISNIYNFPNPFNSTTRFIYTLTGPGAPSFYKIEIMTVTGVLICEITQDQIGRLVGGTHPMDFEWDGTDFNGAPLSAGVYLYRLVAEDENQNAYPVYNPYGSGDYSDKGWGKLIIAR